MFIWTIGDLIGAIILGLAALFFGLLFALIKFDDWRRKRRHKIKVTPNS